MREYDILDVGEKPQKRLGRARLVRASSWWVLETDIKRAELRHRLAVDPYRDPEQDEERAEKQFRWLLREAALLMRRAK